MFNKTEKAIIHRIALEHNLPDRVVRDIVASKFEFAALSIEDGDKETGDFNTVLVQNFGRFAPIKSRWEYYKKRNDKRNKNISQREEDHSEGSVEDKGAEGMA